MSEEFIRIVPVPGAIGTNGTRVFVGETEIHAVTRIELIAEVGGVWKARIDCIATVEAIDALAEFNLLPLRPAVRRVKSRHKNAR